MTSEILGHFINGVLHPDQSRPMPVTDPSTGSVTKHVAMASTQTVSQAVAAAAAAFQGWRDTPPLKRARIMFRYKALLERDAEEIAGLITAEHGKVIDDAMGEFGRGVEVV
ncbi:MAG: aldehyde dehydrogenase family protein, partial [Pseudomonadota bacterium]